MFVTDTENTTFSLAADFINKSNYPVFLTGKAGTGKTTFLKYIKENTIKNAVIVAPTGVAAMNAGGTTIHSFFQLPFTPFLPGAHTNNDLATDKHSLLGHLKMNAERKELIQQLDLLIIDEISMVRADVLDAIDTVMRHVRGNHAVPFGGVQVLYIGDMYQLPPVIKPEEWQLLSSVYSGPFFFSSQVITAQAPVYIELDKIYRQTDAHFIHLLNQVRNNEMDEAGYELLHSRLISNDLPKDESTITLTTHNAKADSINAKALAAINAKASKFNATIEGTFFESAYPADEVLELKPGAQVMFIKNDMEKVRRYYNGKIGIVHQIDDDKVWVECFTGDERQLVEVKKEIWRNIRYSLNKSTGRIDEEELGTFSQYPLRLAWAITIHKSQGLTFDKVIIDAGNAFSPGQVYVALSRCTSLSGITLLSKISYNSLQSDQRIVAFAKNQQSRAEQSSLLINAAEEFSQQTLQSVFDLSAISVKITALIKWIGEQEHFRQRLAGWIQDLNKAWHHVSRPATKFVHQLQQLYHAGEAHLVDQRVIAATGYFLKELPEVIAVVQRSPAVTDNRQLALDHDGRLKNLFDELSKKIHLMEGCKEGYTLEKYQQQRSSFKKKPWSFNSYAGRSSYVSSDVLYPELYNLLKEKRDDLCRELNLPVFMVCGSQSIEQMTNALPMTLHDLGKIQGFGKVKLKQFGMQFIDIINEYCQQHSLESRPDALPVKKVRKSAPTTLKPDTKSVSFELYSNGKSVEEIASERKLTKGTIENHLAHYVSEGKISLEAFLAIEKQKVIKEVKQKMNTVSINTLKAELPQISYSELRFFLAAEKLNS